MPQFKKIAFYDQITAMTIVPTNNMAMISITCPGDKDVALNPKWKHLLILQFHDISKPERPYKLFSREQAKYIIDFVESEFMQDVDTIIVHCHAGISRSAAVAKFIGYINIPRIEDFNRSTMCMNSYVYSTLIEEYYGPIR